MADMGMDVVKVEPPGGDRTRGHGPYLDDIPGLERSLTFWWLNAGKRGVTLDLETEEGRASFHNLAAKADILVESFRPGYLDRLGIGYLELEKTNPGLIMASITGFGQDGPYSDLLSSDIVAEAMGGQMFESGGRDTPPLRLPGDQAYRLASLFAGTGILLALRWRRSTGRGQHIDISLQECVAAALDHVLPRYFSQGEVARRQSSLQWNGAFRVFPCRDGHIVMSLFLQWDTLVEWLDSDGMAADLTGAVWRDPGHRRANVSHIGDVLGAWARKHSAVELEERGQLMGFPWARVASLKDVAASRQSRSRQFFVRIEHEKLGKRFKFPGAPCRLSRTPWNVRGRAPLRGEHNAELLGCAHPFERQERPANPDIKGQALPLQGIRVVDFTRVLAGPYATRILADFGAEVMKVQIPGAEEQDTVGRAYHETWNRNKLSITLDLSRPEGIEVVYRLIARSDVLVENFSPRVMANWGLDYEGVRLVNPGIVMVSLSAMGQAGPQKDFTGFGPTVHALSGLTYLTSFPGVAPLGPGHASADHVAGLVGALAALAALEHRDRTGEGQHVDVSETEAVCALLGAPLLECLINGVDPGPQGNRSVYAAPHGCYRCKGEDAWCAISIEDEGQWRRFVRAIGSPAWAGEPRFGSGSTRLTNDAELDRLVESWTRERSADEVMAMLQRAEIPAGRVQDAADLTADAQLNSRGFFLDSGSDVMPGLKSDASPIRLSRTPARYWRPAPSPNQDRGYVLKEVLGTR
ncbi:MAG: CoA transferase [Planctomycetota bacterium]